MKNKNIPDRHKKETPLKNLYKLFKPNIFNNQVIFYNLLFFIYRDIDSKYLNELRVQIEQFLHNKNTENFVDLYLTKDFYKRILNLYDEDLIYYPDTNANKVTSTCERVKISQAINKHNATAIPHYWKKTYLSPDNMNSYKKVLDITLKYYLLAFKIDTINLEKSNSFNNITLRDEIFEILSKNIISLDISLKDTESLRQIKSLDQIESIIINQIHRQCETNSISPLQEQMEEFQKHIECYGEKNLNKYYALKRYAETNVYAAYKLGDLYYYGAEFYTEERQNKLSIKPDIVKAKYYYSKCTTPPTLLTPACWSLGFILFEEAKKEQSIETFQKAKTTLLLCEDYPPAQNSLGKLELYLAESLQNNRPISELDKKTKEKCLNHYISFIKYCFNACHGDWVYSFNTLYDFFTNPKYSEIRVALKNQDKKNTQKEYIELDPDILLEESIRRENPWAKEAYAMQCIRNYIWNNNYSPTNDKDELLILLKQGKFTLKELSIKPKSILPKELFEAKKMLKELDKLNYDRATYHLAINFYYDTPNLSILLEKAASQGHKQAIVALNQLKHEFENE